MLFVWKPRMALLSGDHMFSSYKTGKMYESLFLVWAGPPCLILLHLLQVELSYRGVLEQGARQRSLLCW